MWTEEDEEKFNDTKVINLLTREKRSVMGNFEDGILIREKTVQFVRKKLFGEKLEIYLPQEEGDKSDIGAKAFYPSDMGEFEEIVTKDGKYVIVPECISIGDDVDIESFIEEMFDNINERYEDTKFKKIRDYYENEWNIKVLYGVAELEKQMLCLVFIIKADNKIYRIYFTSESSDYEPMIILAYKIIENISIKR